MPKQPNAQEFFTRPSEKLVTELLGHELVTPAGKYLITMTEGFNDLVRKDMQQDFDSKDREAGEICVTRFRGWPQLNVVGRHPKGTPQLTWLRKMENGGVDDEATSSTVVRDLAEQFKERLKKPADYVDFAREHLDGKTLWKPRGEVRIEPATPEFLNMHARGVTALPLKEGKGKKKQQELANADNSVGIGELGAIDIGSQAELRKILEKEGQRIAMTVEEMIDPKNWALVLKKSRLVARIIKRLESRD